MSDWIVALCVALGGGLGAAARYLIDSAFSDRLKARFPWGILIVNLSGSFVLGVLTGLALGEPLMTVLAVGVLGGYTTLSTASLDTVQLLQKRRYVAALWNGVGVLLAAVILAALGVLLGQAI